MKVVERISYDDIRDMEVSETLTVELADESRMSAVRSNISQFGFNYKKKFSIRKCKDAGDKCIIEITRNS